MSKSKFLFGTVGSPKSTPNKPGGSIGAIPYLDSIGLDALELGWVRSVRVSETTCQNIKSTSTDCGIFLSVHAPYYINLNANVEEWPNSRKRLMDAAYFGYLAGATDIVFHPGSYFGKPADEVLPLAVDRLNGCVEELRLQGNPVILRPETMGKSAMLGSLVDVLKMSVKVAGVEPCLDFPHLFARTGDERINTYGEWMDILQQYGTTLGVSSLQRLHIHLSGIEYTKKGEKKHLPIHESDLDIGAILQALKDTQCGGRILCESPVLEDDALLLQEKWRNLVSG